MKKGLIQEIIDLLRDEKIAKELEAAGSQEACYKAMKGYIPGLEKSDFIEAMTQLKAATSNERTKLTEEELDKIAGGIIRGDEIPFPYKPPIGPVIQAVTAAAV